MLDFFKTDISLIIILVINVILFISVIVSNARINRIKRNNEEFLKKLGDGKNIGEDINKYMERIIELEKALSETNTHCNQIEKQVKKCVQKVGIVRYNAYKDSGKDLSFAVALLDEKDTGVVFNGIYSREMSNIYAKPVIDGVSKFNLIPEEKQAIKQAIEPDEVKKWKKYENSIDKYLFFVVR